MIHGLRGRASNRRVSEEVRQKIVRVLSQKMYRDFGPTLASGISGQQSWGEGGPRAAAADHDGGGIIGLAAAEPGTYSRLNAAEAFAVGRWCRGTPAITALAGGTRSPTLPEPHDRRRDQRTERALCDQRFQRGEYAYAVELCGAERSADDVLRRQGQPSSNRPKDVKVSVAGPLGGSYRCSGLSG